MTAHLMNYEGEDPIRWVWTTFDYDTKFLPGSFRLWVEGDNIIERRGVYNAN